VLLTKDSEVLLTPEGMAREESVLECLLFRCCGQLLACESSQVARVLRPPRLVPLPRSSGAVAGLLNYRGRIIGAIDLTTLLGQEQATDRCWPWLIVLKGKQFLTGLLVDEVLGIEAIPLASLVNAAADQPGFLPKNCTIQGATASLLAVEALLAHPAIVVTQ
jgi:chemotaxis signal transduction protein